MCRLRNIAMRDYQESVTTEHPDRRTDRQTDAVQSDPYVPLCFACDTKRYNISCSYQESQSLKHFEGLIRIRLIYDTSSLKYAITS